MKTFGSIVTVILLGVVTLSALADDQQGKMHTATIEITAKHGEVGSHFSRYEGHERIEIKWSDDDNKEHSATLGIPKSKFTKIINRDDSSPRDQRRITPAKPWNQSVNFSGPGIYILDISDWDHDPDITVKLIVDDVVKFQGNGNKDNFSAWSSKTYGAGVRKTDDREIAFILND